MNYYHEVIDKACLIVAEANKETSNDNNQEYKLLFPKQKLTDLIAMYRYELSDINN